MPATAPKSPRTLTEFESLQRRLRITREATGLNQADFCRRTGISQQAWNNYERGEVRISLNAALKLCAAFGITLDWIYRGLAEDGLPPKLLTNIQRLEREETRRVGLAQAQ